MSQTSKKSRKKSNDIFPPHLVAWKNEEGKDEFTDEEVNDVLWQLAQSSFGGNLGNGIFWKQYGWTNRGDDSQQ